MVVKVKIPLKGGAEIITEGDLDYVKNTIENMDELFNVLKTAVGEIPTITEPITSIENVKDIQDPSVTPQIPPESKKKLSDAITYLLKSSWGQTPKTFPEIQEALQTNVIHRGKGPVAGTLHRLASNGAIRRFRNNPKDDWKYVGS